MVHNIRLTPPRPIRPRRLLPSPVRNGRIQQQIVEPVLAQLLQRLLGKCPGAPQIRQLEREDGQTVPGAVILERVVRRLGPADVTRAEDEVVGLRLGE
jgi:hypothetical protein